MDRYLSLLDAVADHSRHLLQSLPSSDGPQPFGKKLSEVSYNFLLTPEYMQIVPRTKEKCTLQSEKPGGEELQVSVNSLGFAGMLLVKSEEELEAVKKAGVIEVLKSVTYPLLPADAEDREPWR